MPKCGAKDLRAESRDTTPPNATTIRTALEESARREKRRQIAALLGEPELNTRFAIRPALWLLTPGPFIIDFNIVLAESAIGVYSFVHVQAVGVQGCP